MPTTRGALIRRYQSRPGTASRRGSHGMRDRVKSEERPCEGGHSPWGPTGRARRSRPAGRPRRGPGRTGPALRTARRAPAVAWALSASPCSWPVGPAGGCPCTGSTGRAAERWQVPRRPDRAPWRAGPACARRGRSACSPARRDRLRQGIWPGAPYPQPGTEGTRLPPPRPLPLKPYAYSHQTARRRPAVRRRPALRRRRLRFRAKPPPRQGRAVPFLRD